jgi:transposase-like protein
MQVNIKNLIDEMQCYQTVHDLRWPDGVECPAGRSTQVIKRGFDDTESARQRYECTDCHKRFDELTDTIFAGPHQPLKVWILCLYFMGLNLSNDQSAQEFDVNRSDVQQMTSQREFSKAFADWRGRRGSHRARCAGRFWSHMS